MDRFLIGQFGRYDRLKQQRDFRDEFYGVEACSIEKEEDINELSKDLNKSGHKLCVHFPLRADKWKLRDPQYLSRDTDIKRQSYDYMAEELKYISSIGAQYVLFHYPKPFLVDRDIDLTGWRFSDDTEYCFEDSYSYDEFTESSEEFFIWLSSMSEKYGFTPVLEFDLLNRYIYDSPWLEDMLKKYDKIRLCLDVARLHLQAQIDVKFNGCDTARRYARYAEVVHLSNSSIKGNFTSNHYPPLRTLKPEDGWADIEAYLRIINSQNKDYKVLFEHRSDLINNEQLDDCYRWIEELLKY